MNSGLNGFQAILPTVKKKHFPSTTYARIQNQTRNSVKIYAEEIISPIEFRYGLHSLKIITISIT
ncbi:hypothetical protein T10_7790 [Trichinella papuae]|uniref:Uncharacterized protein n=1 Tax=Trichinella papuae TaxID=268474 RepID=A0A0V1MQ72_9BILA|nr:hypothetical protein T10_7790 [Trichinella papuae]